MSNKLEYYNNKFPNKRVDILKGFLWEVAHKGTEFLNEQFFDDENMMDLSGFEHA